MAGWNVPSGDISDSVVFEDEIWTAFNYFFSDSCRKNTTYKYGFLKSILDNLFSVEPTSRGLELSFQQLFDKFTENYWNLILKYNLKQAKVTSRVKYSGIERIIREAVHQYRLPEFAEYSSLDASLQNNYYAWAKLLEKYNVGNVTNCLLNKLEDATPKRHNLSLYRDILRNEFGAVSCFYCHKKLTDKSQVDHVIPWQMVREDKLWNFVLACPSCNASKNNRIPTKPVIRFVIERNDIIRTYGSSLQCVAEDFQNYSDDMMVNLWGYAKNGGFQEWQR